MPFQIDYQTVIAVGTPTVGALIFVFKSIMNVQSRLVRLETQMEPMWGKGGIMMQAMSSLIKQPIHFHKDELVDKFRDNSSTMSVDELEDLRNILQQEYEDLERLKDPKIMAYAPFLKWIEQELQNRRKIKTDRAQGILRKLCKAIALCG